MSDTPPSLSPSRPNEAAGVNRDSTDSTSETTDAASPSVEKVQTANEAVERVAPDNSLGEVIVEEQKPRRLPWIIATAVLGLALIGVGIYANHLWGVSEEWATLSASVDKANQELGGMIASERATVQQQGLQIELLTEQLETAQRRITELADLTARAGDDVQYYAQEINRLNETLTAASTVATALSRCAEGHEQLLTYTRDPGNYDPVQVADFEASLQTLCDRAAQSHEDLQLVLAQ